MAAKGSKLSIYAAIVANVLISILKFIASFFTGSSAMFSEGIHSLIDTFNGVLLLLGISKSKKGPNKQHAFGYGKEVYFWSFVVSILVFSLGGGVAIYEGIHRLLYPIEAYDNSNILWNYGVLIGAIIFEGTSLFIGLKQFRKVHPTGFKSALEKSKDTASVAIIIEETAAVSGLVIALIGITLAHFLNNPFYDAAASILIGILLVYVAYFMANETRHLLIGESAIDEDIQEIKDILKEYKEIEHFGNIRTMHLGPDEIIAVIEVNFKDDLKVLDVERMVREIKNKIKSAEPKFTHVYIETDSINKSTFN